MRGTILTATLVAGTLDILAAVALTLHAGGHPTNMLRSVASGPFPPATEWGAAGALLGLVVHFAIMAVMVAAYVWAARRSTWVATHPAAGGILYGVATWAVMNGLVLPLRFGAPFPPEPTKMATQLFCHIVLVGLPIAYLATAEARRRAV